MVSKTLSKISTQWTLIEEMSEAEGPAKLAQYLAVRYFDVLASKFQLYCPQLDDLRTHELASDVMYDLIKNDYRGVKRLDRDRGLLRGLFFKIIKTKLAGVGKERKLEILEEYEKHETEESMDKWLNVYLDFDASLERLKKERPRLYQPFFYHYLEGKKISEIAELMGVQANAIKQRLYAARRCLAEWLQDYKEE